MKVNMIPTQPILLNKIDGNKEQQKGAASSLESFGKVLHNKLQEANQLQHQADELTKQFVAGEQVELHDVMLATEQANLALQLTVQIRNKVIEAYQEVARMQI